MQPGKVDSGPRINNASNFLSRISYNYIRMIYYILFKAILYTCKVSTSSPISILVCISEQLPHRFGRCPIHAPRVTLFWLAS
jgi:hypothetical protein